MDYYAKSIAEVMKKTGTPEKGLPKAEATKRLNIAGLNIITKEKKDSILLKFFREFTDFLIIVLIVAAIVSFAIGELIDALVILIIVVLNAILGFVQEYKAEKSLEALRKMAAPYALVVRDGRQIRVPAEEIVVGDLLILEEGDKIAADARVIKSIDLNVDEATLTGESHAILKIIEKLKSPLNIGDRKNMVYSGTIVTHGRGQAIVVATGMNTELGRIAGLVQETKSDETPLQKKLGSFGKKLGVAILVLCLIIFAMGLLRWGISTDNILFMFLATVSLAVAAIPEGLPAVVTMALAIGTQRMAKKNAIIRKLPAVETLGNCDIICTDKTGTLTKNEMTVKRLYVDGSEVAVTGTGYHTEGSFVLKGNIESRTHMEDLVRAGVLCNNSTFDKGNVTGDPTEIALLVLGAKLGLIRPELESKFERIYEIPFDSGRKMMSVVNRSGRDRTMYSKGAVENILQECTHILKEGGVKKLTAAERKNLLKENDSMAGKALRVLGFAYRKLPANRKLDNKLEEKLVFIGMLGMIDPPREECFESIKVAREAGIDVKMITGDHAITATAIAEELGIYREGDEVVTGLELAKMDEKELLKRVEGISVFARVDPEHKLMIVEALKKNGHVVAMTGDGVNDAPALKKAEIGVSMGITGTEVSKETSSMILTDDNFSTIVNAIEQGRIIYENIRKFILFLISSNAGEVLTMFLAILIGWPLPLIAVQILWVNLVTDGMPAIALGMDPPEDGLMKRKPRPVKEGIFTPFMLKTIILVGIIISVGTLWIYNSELGLGEEKARTMAFTALMMFQMVNVFNCRSVRQSIFKVGFLKNRKLLLAVAASLILQLLVIYLPILNDAFETVPLGAMDWAKIIVVSLSVLVAVELWKFFGRMGAKEIKKSERKIIDELTPHEQSLSA